MLNLGKLKEIDGENRICNSYKDKLAVVTLYSRVIEVVGLQTVSIHVNPHVAVHYGDRTIVYVRRRFGHDMINGK